MELETVFDYDALLADAKKEFIGKEVNSKNIFDWFHTIGLFKYIRYPTLERLMFKLRHDLSKTT